MMGSYHIGEKKLRRRQNRQLGYKQMAGVKVGPLWALSGPCSLNSE